MKPRHWIALSIVALLAAAPFALDSERRVLDDSDRASAVGTFVNLSLGKVHHQIGGPADGPRVVLVHGFSTPLFTWDAVFAGLTSAGFRTMRYDHYGRGLSDRPTDVDYDLDLYDDQLRELIAAAGWTEPVHVIGLSMGGAIAIEYAARRPDRVASLGLFDPAGFPIDMPFATRLITLPMIGEYLIKTVGGPTIRKNLARNFHDPELLPEFEERYLPQMDIEGFKYSQLSTLRHMPLNDMRERYEMVGRTNLPVLLFWGRQDRVVPFANAALVQKAIPQTQLVAVDECGHTPNYEKPEIVIPPLIAFLRKASAPGSR